MAVNEKVFHTRDTRNGLQMVIHIRYQSQVISIDSECLNQYIQPTHLQNDEKNN